MLKRGTSSYIAARNFLLPFLCVIFLSTVFFFGFYAVDETAAFFSSFYLLTTVLVPLLVAIPLSFFVSSVRFFCGAAGLMVALTPVATGLYRLLLSPFTAPMFIVREPDTDGLILFFLFVSVFFVLGGIFAGFVFEELVALSAKAEKGESGPVSRSKRRKKKKRKHRADLAATKSTLVDEILDKGSANAPSGGLADGSADSTEDSEDSEDSDESDESDDSSYADSDELEDDK
jgi:hypothetical protein